MERINAALRNTVCSSQTVHYNQILRGKLTCEVSPSPNWHEIWWQKVPSGDPSGKRSPWEPCPCHYPPSQTAHVLRRCCFWVAAPWCWVHPGGRQVFPPQSPPHLCVHLSLQIPPCQNCQISSSSQEWKAWWAGSLWGTTQSPQVSTLWGQTGNGLVALIPQARQMARYSPCPELEQFSRSLPTVCYCPYCPYPFQNGESKPECPRACQPPHCRADHFYLKLVPHSPQIIVKAWTISNPEQSLVFFSTF